MNDLNDSIKKYNQRANDVIEIDWYLETEANALDDNYFARLKILAFVEENKEAKEEYEKILRIKQMTLPEKFRLLGFDSNGKLKLEEHNLSPKSNIYVVSKLIQFKDFWKLMQLENVNGKTDFIIRRLGIENSEIVRLLADRKNESLKQVLLTEEIEENGEKKLVVDKLGLNKEEIRKLLCSNFSANRAIIENLINDRYGDFGEEKTALILLNSDFKKLKELLKHDEIFEGKEELKHKLSETYKKVLELTDTENTNSNLVWKEIYIPENMTVGVELEMLGPVSGYLYGALSKSFEGKSDVTIRDGEMEGVEIVSPILTNKNIDEALNMAKTLKEIGQYTNNTCGGHIHIGSQYLTVYKDEKIDEVSTKLAWKSFLEIWKNTEDIMYKICNGVGKEHRGIKFTKPLALKMEKMLEDETLEFQNGTDIRTMKERLKEIQLENDPIITERNYSVNFDNLNNNKNTIEFRLPNGTLESEELKANIELFTGVIDISRKLGIAKTKEIEGKSLTIDERNILELDKKLVCNNQKPEEEKADLLFKLIFKEKERYAVYEDRYSKSNFCMEEELQKMIAKKHYDYSKYGETVPYEDLKRLKRCMEIKSKENENNEEIEEIKYMKEDLEEIEKWNRENNRGIMQLVIANIKNKLKKTKKIKKEKEVEL